MNPQVFTNDVVLEAVNKNRTASATIDMFQVTLCLTTVVGACVCVCVCGFPPPLNSLTLDIAALATPREYRNSGRYWKPSYRQQCQKTLHYFSNKWRRRRRLPPRHLHNMVVSTAHMVIAIATAPSTVVSQIIQVPAAHHSKCQWMSSQPLQSKRSCSRESAHIWCTNKNKQFVYQRIHNNSRFK